MERLRRMWSSRVHSGVETEGVEGVAAGVELQGCILGVEVVTQLQWGQWEIGWWRDGVESVESGVTPM